MKRRMSPQITQIDTDDEYLFCCWNPSSLGYAVARKTQQQKGSSPAGDTSLRIAFLPCRMAMAFACQPLIAGRQKENLSVSIRVICGQ
jgi:hypothetical protein